MEEPIVSNQQTPVEERNRIIPLWRKIAEQQFADGADIVRPAHLQEREPTTSPQIELLAKYALQPLCDAGVCRRHERFEYGWYVIVSRENALAYQARNEGQVMQ